MVSNFRFQGVFTIFYNFRKSVYKAIRGIDLSPSEFYHCNNEKEVYAVIKNITNTRFKRSQSMIIETLISQSMKAARLNWASQSAEAF